MLYRLIDSPNVNAGERGDGGKQRVAGVCAVQTISALLCLILRKRWISSRTCSGSSRSTSTGPFGSETEDWMQDTLNVHPRAVIRRVKQYRCGYNTNIELFEYESPDQRREMPKNSDWGGHHIALYVDDFDAAMEHLRSHDVRLMPGGGGPAVADGPEAGLRSCYFLTPWGMQMELISYPGGKGYEATTERRLWDPRQRE